MPVDGKHPEIPDQPEASDQEVVPGDGDPFVAQPPRQTHGLPPHLVGHTTTGCPRCRNTIGCQNLCPVSNARRSASTGITSSQDPDRIPTARRRPPPATASKATDLGSPGRLRSALHQGFRSGRPGQSSPQSTMAISGPRTRPDRSSTGSRERILAQQPAELAARVVVGRTR